MDDAEKSPDKEKERKKEGEYEGAIVEHIDLPLRNLTDQIRTLVEHVSSNAEADRAAHNERYNQQLSLQKSLRRVSRVSVALTFGVGFLTFLVLYATLGVYDRQAKLTRIGLMPQVMVAGLRVSYRENGNANLLVVNFGHSNATDATIAVREQDRGHMPDSFDPFADDMDRSAKGKQKIAQSFHDEQREIADMRKHVLPNHQAEWASRIHKQYDEDRRLAREEGSPASVVAQIKDLPEGQSASYTLSLKIQSLMLSPGGRSLFFYGTVRYRDPTDDNKRTSRQFCWRYDTLEQVSSECLRFQTQPPLEGKSDENQ